MAHSPEKKAAAIADLMLGVPVRQVARDHSISVGTASAWLSELNVSEHARTENRTPELLNTITAEAKQRRFDQALDKLLFTGMDMLQAWAELGGDKDFVRSKPIEAKDLGSAVLDRLDRIMALVETNRQEE